MATNKLARMPRVGERLPENVTWLPTAAKRKPPNHRFAAQCDAARELRNAQPWPGEYVHPSMREADKRAEVFARLEMTPALGLMEALLVNSSADQRERMEEWLSKRPQNLDWVQEARLCLRMSHMTYGESVDLQNAIYRRQGILFIREEEEGA